MLARVVVAIIITVVIVLLVGFPSDSWSCALDEGLVRVAATVLDAFVVLVLFLDNLACG